MSAVANIKENIAKIDEALENIKKGEKEIKKGAKEAQKVIDKIVELVGEEEVPEKLAELAKGVDEEKAKALKDNVKELKAKRKALQNAVEALEAMDM